MRMSGALALLILAGLFAWTGELDETTRKEHFNLESGGLAVDGYDPISYFMNGPEKGRKTITTTFRGVTYRFINAANKATFDADPEKYEPAYGGWCATAMLSNDRVKINPTFYKIVDGRLLLFYKGLLGNARKAWNDKIANGASESDLVRKSEQNWQESLM